MTASCLLTNYGTLQPGDRVIHNAANSAVGKMVIRLARARGIRTVNVVRRAAAGEDLAALGADVVVVDGPDLAQSGAVRDLGPERTRARYLELAAMVMDGRLTTHIEATYPIDRVREALAHAERGARAGKIVLTF